MAKKADPDAAAAIAPNEDQMKQLSAALLVIGAFVSLEARSQSLPQGLTCGLANIEAHDFVSNACNGVQTLYDPGYTYTCYDYYFGDCRQCICSSECFLAAFYDPYLASCDARGWPQAAPGYTAIGDGDYGNTRRGQGYWHQELANGVTDPSLGGSFVLPKGATCGFHHTRNSPGRTCMGYDPANLFGLRQDGPAPGIAGCPPGWAAKKAFDMSSNYGYWVWCEYQDPNHLSWGSPSVQPVGIACGASHNDATLGTAGQCMDYATVGYSPNGPQCPPGMSSFGWVDDGEPAGIGLGFCTAGSTLPPPYEPPPPPSCDSCGPHDCGQCPPNEYCDGQKGGAGCGGCYCTQ